MQISIRHWHKTGQNDLVSYSSLSQQEDSSEGGGVRAGDSGTWLSQLFTMGTSVSPGALLIPASGLSLIQGL